MYCHLQIGTVEAYGRQNLYGWMGFPHRMLIITVLCRSSLGYKTSTGAVLHLLSQLQIRCWRCIYLSMFIVLFLNALQCSCFISKKYIFCPYRLLWDRIMWKMRFTSLIPCKDNMKKHWNSKAIVNLLMLSCLLVSSRAMNNVRSCRWWFFLTKKSNYTGGHCTGFNVPDRALIILHPEC